MAAPMRTYSWLVGSFSRKDDVPREMPQVGYFFNKIQCFCFEEQRLRPGESIDLPVFFYIDPEFATDRRLRNVDHVTLSYVFFKTGEVPKNIDGTELIPGESMPAELLPSRTATA
jgi:Cytochrome c oxidase assembly protein CtaG/Cox11